MQSISPHSEPTFSNEPAPSSPWTDVAKTIGSIVLFLVLVFGAAAFLNTFVFQSYYVDGTSMTPTLSNNDRLIISKVEKSVAEVQHQRYVPSRGQIVVLDSSVSPLTTERSEQIIKRVVGLPGERLHIEGGKVTVYNHDNPKGFDVDQQLGLKLASTYLADQDLDVQIPDDSVFVLGDNRAPGGSYDSRYFGTISTDKIVGRLWLRILPLTQMSSF